MTDDELLVLQAEAARCGMTVAKYLTMLEWGALFAVERHATCDDPDCSICVQRERDAAIALERNPRINRTVAKIKKLAKRRARRPRA